MTPRQVVRAVIEGERPPYVPWQFSFTWEAEEKLRRQVGDSSLGTFLRNHMQGVGWTVGVVREIGDGRVRDYFGVEWDRRVDRDIGVVAHGLLPEPTLRGYSFPDPVAPELFRDLPAALAACGNSFRYFAIGFSLYERAWTLRGMENLLLDFLEHPRFVRDLFRAIADFNLAVIRKAVRYDVDAIYLGDDWGQQRGLQMGYPLWKRFIYPELKRMYSAVREAGKFVMIHSCGDVDELFDDLIELGVNVFNPFQPEVMDTSRLLKTYRGRLTFHGGLSTQRVLPYGTPAEVRAETLRLIREGQAGGYILAPAHAVEGDVPLDNMLAMIETAVGQVI